MSPLNRASLKAKMAIKLLRRTPAADECEPDYRFTLANERTFLAWIRTALGLLAGGVAVDRLGASPREGEGSNLLVLGCIVFAIAVAGGAYFRWASVRRAMRRDSPLPGSLLVPVLAGGVGVIAVVVSVTTLFS